MKLPTHATRHALLVLAGACAYVMFIVLVLGRDMSPVHPQWEWQLSFEHGELNAEHYSHILGIILAALPVVCFALVAPGSGNVPRMLLWIGLVAAVPYLATPQLPYAEEQTWLLRYSVELETLKIAVAPWLLSRILGPAFSRFSRFGKP